MSQPTETEQTRPEDKWPIAKQDLKIGVVLAFVAGDPVPPETVETQGWGDLVTGPNTKAAAKVREQATEGAPSS